MKEHSPKPGHGHELSDDQIQAQLDVIANFRAQCMINAILPILTSPACDACRLAMVQGLLEQLIGSFILISRSKGATITVDQTLTDMKDSIQAFIDDINNDLKRMVN